MFIDSILRKLCRQTFRGIGSIIGWIKCFLGLNLALMLMGRSRIDVSSVYIKEGIARLLGYTS